MADTINLRTARKLRARAEKEKRAEENRVCFGRTKAQKTIDKTRSEKASRALEAHRRERAEDE